MPRVRPEGPEDIWLSVANDGDRAADSAPPDETPSSPDARAVEGALAGAVPLPSAVDIQKAFGGISLPRMDHAELWLANLAHDREQRQTWSARMSGPQTYSDWEEISLARQLTVLDSFVAIPSRGKQLDLHPTFEQAWMKHDRASKLMIAYAVLTIRGALPDEVAAFMMDRESRITQSSLDPNVQVRLKILEQVNDHHVVDLLEVKTAPFRNRVFITASICKKISGSPSPAFVLVKVPVAKHKLVTRSSERHSVRGENSGCWRLSLASPNITRMEFVHSVDLKGNLPPWLYNKLVLPKMFSGPYELQVYFQKCRPSNACTAEDGKRLGRMLMWTALRSDMHERDLAVRDFCMETEVLRNAKCRYLWSMLASMSHTRFLLAEPVTVPDELAVLTEANAVAIGSGIAFFVVGNTMPAKAAEDFLCLHPSTRSLQQDNEWFRPMIEAIVSQLMRFSFTTKLRVLQNAFFSYVDILSDLLSLVTYFFAGRIGFGLAMLATVFLTASGQTFVVVLKNQRRGRFAIVKEVLIVLFFLKNAVDSHRLASGTVLLGELFGTSIERAAIQCFQIVVGGIPSAIIQIALLLELHYSQWPWYTLVSISTSWLLCSWKVASMVLRLDRDPAERSNSPEFYGFSSGADWGKYRAKALFASLYLVVLTHIAGRTLSVACLFKVNPLWLLASLSAEMAVYVFIKVARSEFIVWLPNSGVVISLIYRTPPHVSTISLG